MMRNIARRRFLRGASAVGAAGVALAAAGVAGAEAFTANDKKKSHPTFVFVNGSNASGNMFGDLGRVGLRTLAVELPGHGMGDGQFPACCQCPQDLDAWAAYPSPMKGVSLPDYVAVTVDAVRQVAEYGPVILVGTSMGGAIISKVANEVPELLDRLVYNTAFCCVDMPSIADYLTSEAGQPSLGATLAPWTVGDPAVIGATRLNWRSGDPEFLTAAKECLLNDGTDAEVLTMLANLHPDEATLPSTQDATGDKDTWGAIPRSYIRHSLDKMIPIGLQDKMIREADKQTPDNPFDVHTVETSHAGTAAKTAEIVKILAAMA